jgi:hypothetical protein
MTDPAPAQPETDLLPPEAPGAFAVPPPVPQKKPGFLSRLFTSRKKQQAVAMQNGYLEMVDLIRAIRSHLDRQENLQTSVLTMLEKVPGAMDRQHEVMTMFKQQLENGMENNRRLTDSMGNLNNTLSAMDESQKASSRTITDLIHRSRESEQLLREVMRRAERRMTILLAFFFLLVIALGFYFLRWQPRPRPAPAPAETAAPAVAVVAAQPEAKAEAAEPIVEQPAVAEFVADEPAAPAAPAPEPKQKSKKKAKAEPKPADPVLVAPVADAAPALGQHDLTLDHIQQAVGAPLAEAPGSLPAEDKPVSIP